MTFRAREAIEQAEVIAGYKTYIELIRPMIEKKRLISTGMTREIERCREAALAASEGHRVALISSGDAGIYGMAGLMLEVLEDMRKLDEVEIEVIPGVTAASGAAALLGAPLMHDFCAISLSDLLTPLDTILRRVEAAASADFVIVLYNPKSKKRTKPIEAAQEILLRYRGPDTPVGIVRSALRAGQKVVLSRLKNLLEHPIDMQSVVIIGNSQTRQVGSFLITPRGYQL
ncbi:Precorrin-3B methylase [Calderihabitans maritimus]|uniref:Precorrin-3B methylase n=2 Tax=Calderihabitans maritimus TaxID=1246530 RepID=A0A1Z5HPS3_9FIRM|nr:Precorrin-3B methylase [Calderihabitans maritimus]